MQSMSLKDAVSALRSLKAELEASRSSKAELENAYRGVLEVRYILLCTHLRGEPREHTAKYFCCCTAYTAGLTTGRGATNRQMDAGVFSCVILRCLHNTGAIYRTAV